MIYTLAHLIVSKLLYGRQSLHAPCTTDDPKVQLHASDVIKGSAHFVVHKLYKQCRVCSIALIVSLVQLKLIQKIKPYEKNITLLQIQTFLSCFLYWLMAL